jgi:hypothetical protein
VNPVRIAYGERYGDDSGWQKLLSIDTHDENVMIELSGTDAHIKLDDLWWLVRAALEAREKLGMDKLAMDGPSPATVGAPTDG